MNPLPTNPGEAATVHVLGNLTMCLQAALVRLGAPAETLSAQEDGDLEHIHYWLTQPIQPAPVVPGDGADLVVRIRSIPISYSQEVSAADPEIYRWGFQDAIHLAADLVKSELAATAGAGDSQLLAQIEQLKTALRKCRDRFTDYEVLHSTKGTVEGGAKAHSNRSMAVMCEEALAQPGSEPREEKP